VKRTMMRHRTREQSSISAFRRDDDGAPQQRFAQSDFDPVTHHHRQQSGGEWRGELLFGKKIQKKKFRVSIELRWPRNTSHVNTQKRDYPIRDEEEDQFPSQQRITLRTKQQCLQPLPL